MIGCAVVLAAGANHRMGPGTGPKALLPLHPGVAGSPSFLSRNLGLFRAAGVRRTYLVVSDANEHAFAGVAGPDVELVVLAAGSGPAGSTVSMAAGLAAALTTDGGRILVTDADVLYEQALLTAAAGTTGSVLLAIDRFTGDGEEVRVYRRAGGPPVLIGKGLTGPVVHGLDVAGESLGMIVLDRPEATLAADVAGWITGMPPRARPFGFSGWGSEHEEVWQYLFALGRLPVLTLPGTLLFAECDFPEDLDHIRRELYPAVVERDLAGPGHVAPAPDSPGRFAGTLP